MENVCRRLGFHKFNMMDPRAKADGLVLMWSEEVRIKVEQQSYRFICCDILDVEGMRRWSLFSCHGTPYNCEKKVLWDDFEEFIQGHQLPQMVIGDLNEVIGNEEKYGGRSVLRKHLYLIFFFQEC